MAAHEPADRGPEALPTGAELEHSLERAECAMYADLYAALPPAVARSHGISMERRGSELCLTAASVDHPFFNRVMGIGIDPGQRPPLGRAWVEEHTRRYQGAGVRRFMLQLLPHVETAGLRLELERHGLVRLRGWAKHLGPSRKTERGESDLVVRDVAARDVDAWVSVCAEGFAIPSALGPWLRALGGRAGWRLYLAWAGGEPVACAALHHAGGLATLTFAATRPQARRRGAQSALIARRLGDALDLGCRWVIAETDEPLPERPNPSTNNLVRLGLPVRYVRANWGPPKPPS